METALFNTAKWIRIALINFMIVAIAGICLRYKINFPLPVINQKFLLHAHSHFAFVGWITLALMALMTDYLSRQEIQFQGKKYQILMMATNITAFGMLFTFLVQGYGAFSILFSTLSIFVSYVFIVYYWQDLKKIKGQQSTVRWFRSALILWALSSAGAFTLAYLMAAHIKIQQYFFAAIYFFLHFQYNGWFVFACLGLLSTFFRKMQYAALVKNDKWVYIFLVITVVPSYLLSLIWLDLPLWLYWIATVSSMVQLFACLYLFRIFYGIRNSLTVPFLRSTRYLWTLALGCFILKILLQALSTFPALSELTFGFRPVVIAYLHLCFLGVISFFIMGALQEVLKNRLKLNVAGICLFIFGVMFQEFILLLQGLEMMGMFLFSYANMLLFLLAVVIAAGLYLIAFRSVRIQTG